MTNGRLVVTVPDPLVRHVLGDVPDHVDVLDWDLLGPPPRDALDMVIPPYLSLAERLANLTGVRIRLIQSLSIGYDGVAEALPPGHVFANAAGVHETSTAELTLALILASQRGLADFVREGDKGVWSTRMLPSLADRTVLVLGVGGVGRAITRRLAPFEVTLIRVASTARRDDEGVVHGVDELASLLPLADVVVIAVPLTPATTGLVDDTFLSAMKDDALLVNVARGKVADTDALVAHATTRGLRLALDVTDPEPLPSDHRLYGLPHVLITPHVGGATNALLPRAAALLQEQMTRLENGDEPLNVVVRT